MSDQVEAAYEAIGDHELLVKALEDLRKTALRAVEKVLHDLAAIPDHPAENACEGHPETKIQDVRDMLQEGIGDALKPLRERIDAYKGWLAPYERRAA